MNIDRMSRDEHTLRVNAVLDHIHEHFAEPLPLARLSQIAAFSPFHFHRLFKKIVHENVNDYIRRVRTEEAARRLISNDRLTLTDIAERCGFQSLASFSRAFKEIRGIAPSEFRKRYDLSGSRPVTLAEQRFRHDMRQLPVQAPIGGVDQVIEWAVRIVQETTVVHLAPVSVVYCRHRGIVPDRMNEELLQLFKELYREAGRLGCIAGGTQAIGVSYDDPFVTPMHRCRYYAALSIREAGCANADRLESAALPGGLYARLAIAETPRFAALLRELVVQEWLPRSGYRLDPDRPLMEKYAHSPHEDPHGRLVFDLLVPVALRRRYRELRNIR